MDLHLGVGHSIVCVSLIWSAAECARHIAVQSVGYLSGIGWVELRSNLEVWVDEGFQGAESSFKGRTLAVARRPAG